MNQDNNTKMLCPRCGNEMNIGARYCLQCGYLNPANEANQNMQNFIPTENKKNNLYQVGSGQTIMQNTSNQVINSIATNTGNKKICFIINYFLYIGIIILSFYLILGNKTLDFITIKNSLFPYVVFSTSIVFLYVYSMELVFMKANRKWWYALVPFFNIFILCDIVYKKKWLGIILLMPIIGQIFFIVTLYKLAGKFKLNGLMTILLPIIYIPLMGFGSRLYEDTNYMSDDKTLEKDYKRKKIFFISLMIFLIFGGALIFWNNIIEIKSKAFRLQNYYYVFATRQIINKTKQLAEENYLECEGTYYNKGKGIYYIEYSDIGDVAYIPFHAYKDVISGYVVINNNNGNSIYSISISDGTFGYPETLYESINIDTIVPYSKLEERTDLIYCKNTKQKATVGGLI